MYHIRLSWSVYLAHLECCARAHIGIGLDVLPQLDVSKAWLVATCPPGELFECRWTSSAMPKSDKLRFSLLPYATYPH